MIVEGDLHTTSFESVLCMVNLQHNIYYFQQNIHCIFENVLCMVNLQHNIQYLQHNIYLKVCCVC